MELARASGEEAEELEKLEGLKQKVEGADMVPAGEAGAMGFHEKERTVWEKERKEQTNQGGRREAHTDVPGSGKELPHAEKGAVQVAKSPCR